MRLCVAHSGDFIANEKQVSPPGQMICPLESEENESLVHVYQLLPVLTSELTSLYLQHHHRRIQNLLDQIQTAELALVRQLNSIRYNQKMHAEHLYELISRNQLPLMTPDGVVPALVELKTENVLNFDEIMQSVLNHFVMHSSKHLLDGMDEIVLCKKCWHIGLRRDVHADCSVCSDCIDSVSITDDGRCQVCQSLVCKRCSKRMKDTSVFRCDKGCAVCHGCWRESFGKTGACPDCEAPQDDATAQQIIQQLGVTPQKGSRFLKFFGL